MILNQYFKCNKGATAIEYVLMASGIALVILAAVFAFGGDLTTLFGDLEATTTPP